jgi:hypothetical protein
VTSYHRDINVEIQQAGSLIEESQYLSTGLLSAGLVVIHDTVSSGKHNMSETTRRKDILNPLLDVLHSSIEKSHLKQVYFLRYAVEEKCMDSQNEK